MKIFALLTLSLMALASGAPQYGYGFQQQETALYQASQNSFLDTNQNYHVGESKYLPPESPTQAPLVRKQFYLISAPDDSENQPKHKKLILGRPQKNYRVVFIKAPGSDNANIKYSAEYAPQEEKTIIYVLSKKDSELDASDIATPAPTEPSKPEVFFIKYKTNEEAEAAQREIQNEYDKLGGTNEFSDEGVAPITSVVGALDGLTPDGAYNYQNVNPSLKSGEKSPISHYLPASII
ncbi:uncharacterized protein LOC142230714 [Haematobia irritans]|uniref:uncharacterized protein LOC142230714 n=1 Tax=Haematobia irritans TaxID=7368 RepID=UPI003F50215C